MRILVSGSTGFIGSALVRHLESERHTVVPLIRRKSSASGVFWNPEKDEIETGKLDGFDAAVHLAGENIASGRWTPAKKARILNSRVKGTTLLSEALASISKPPQVLISASAVGYYGDRGTETLTENSGGGVGFLAEVCKQWEAATASALRKGIRVVHMRFGVVLGPRGGVLGKMLLPFKLGVGGKVGSGSQYMSWISLDDVCTAILHAIKTPSLQGAVNGVAPNPVTNTEFTKTLGRLLHRPTIFPMPAFAARLVFGEMADELLLASTRATPVKLTSSGFVFKHDRLESALHDAISL